MKVWNIFSVIFLAVVLIYAVYLLYTGYLA